MNLTKREIEVLRLTADECLSAKEIGDKLCISAVTVQNHIRNIKAKKRLSKITELSKLYFVKYARQTGALMLTALFSLTIVSTNTSDIRARRVRRSGRRWETEILDNYGIDY